MSKTASLSPQKLRMRPKSQVIRNYNNKDYHTSLDLAKAYSGMVESHLYVAQYQNHTLKSAEQGFKKQLLPRTGQDKNGTEKQIRRAKSSLNIWERKDKSNKKTISIEDNKVVRNPEDGQGKSPTNPQDEAQNQRKTYLKQLLTRKTFRVPQYSQQLDQACSYKAALQKQIKKLNFLINSEKKKKTKISLNCNKIMNERQLTYKDYKTIEEQNYHLNTSILAIEKENQFLREEIREFGKRNDKTAENAQQQKNQCEILKKFVQKTRLIVFQEEKDVAKLKTMVTTSFNNMSNNFMNMNLLKSQKALLLSDIQTNHSKNK